MATWVDLMAAPDGWCPGKGVGCRAGPPNQGGKVGPPSLRKVPYPNSFPPSYIWNAVAVVSFHGMAPTVGV